MQLKRLPAFCSRGPPSQTHQVTRQQSELLPGHWPVFSGIHKPLLTYISRWFSTVFQVCYDSLRSVKSFTCGFHQCCEWAVSDFGWLWPVLTPSVTSSITALSPRQQVSSCLFVFLFSLTLHMSIFLLFDLFYLIRLSGYFTKCLGLSGCAELGTISPFQFQLLILCLSQVWAG